MFSPKLAHHASTALAVSFGLIFLVAFVWMLFVS